LVIVLASIISVRQIGLSFFIPLYVLKGAKKSIANKFLENTPDSLLCLIGRVNKNLI
jgi:hypothetical protein